MAQREVGSASDLNHALRLLVGVALIAPGPASIAATHPASTNIAP
jgi:hypothetical protein